MTQDEDVDLQLHTLQVLLYNSSEGQWIIVLKAIGNWLWHFHGELSKKSNPAMTGEIYPL